MLRLSVSASNPFPRKAKTVSGGNEKDATQHKQLKNRKRWTLKRHKSWKRINKINAQLCTNMMKMTQENFVANFALIA